MKLPKRVTITEVGPRDGLQAEPAFVATPDKIELINMLAQTGLTRIETTSFVHPRAIPALADAAEVMAGIERVPSVTYSALVPNPKGAERALKSNADVWVLFLSASQSHNRSNVNMEIDESLRGFEPIMEMARANNQKVRGVISTSFGCPFEGPVPKAQVIRIARALADLGIETVGLGDTTGMANPVQVAELASDFIAKVPVKEFNLHFHDTRNTALANILAALQVGVTSFDSSIGGLGGCPYAPGATGNVPTEDVVNMLHEMGVETGIDLEKLLDCAALAERLVGHTLPSHVYKAGPASRLAEKVTGYASGVHETDTRIKV
ncbi:MAG: hydroxymethylglutaryl-CoA lyase [Chloroflexi bacterium]|nr:hydroxymethylglutaryl-CoA lyase [Chloroflexota bacterium]